eukprot:2281240-Rhodomonas_salina.6
MDAALNHNMIETICGSLLDTCATLSIISGTKNCCPTQYKEERKSADSTPRCFEAIMPGTSDSWQVNLKLHQLVKPLKLLPVPLPLPTSTVTVLTPILRRGNRGLERALNGSR